MGKITGLTGERNKIFIRNMFIFVGTMLLACALFLVYMSPYSFHLVPNSLPHKAVGVSMLIAVMISTSYYYSLRLKGQSYKQLDIKERDAQGKKTNRLWRILNWSPRK